MLLLIVIGILVGAATALVVRYATDRRALRATRNRIQAYLLEFRLFFDEPALVWRAQVDLIRENFRLLRLTLPAVAILALPVWWIVLQLDTAYGLRPFSPGESAIVTAQFDRGLTSNDAASLNATAGIAIETPPIRILHDNQIVWRVRAAHDGILSLQLGGQAIEKTIVTAGHRGLPSPRRNRSLLEFVMHPWESRLPDGNLEWVEVDYPKEERSIPWIMWFFASSTLSSLAVARWIK